MANPRFYLIARRLANQYDITPEEIRQIVGWFAEPYGGMDQFMAENHESLKPTLEAIDAVFGEGVVFSRDDVNKFNYLGELFDYIKTYYNEKSEYHRWFKNFVKNAEKGNMGYSLMLKSLYFEKPESAKHIRDIHEGMSKLYPNAVVFDFPFTKFAKAMGITEANTKGRNIPLAFLYEDLEDIGFEATSWNSPWARTVNDLFKNNNDEDAPKPLSELVDQFIKFAVSVFEGQAQAEQKELNIDLSNNVIKKVLIMIARAIQHNQPAFLKALKKANPDLYEILEKKQLRKNNQFTKTINQYESNLTNLIRKLKIGPAENEVQQLVLLFFRQYNDFASMSRDNTGGYADRIHTQIAKELSQSLKEASTLHFWMAVYVNDFGALRGTPLASMLQSNPVAYRMARRSYKAIQGFTRETELYDAICTILSALMQGKSNLDFYHEHTFNVLIVNVGMGTVPPAVMRIVQGLARQFPRQFPSLVFRSVSKFSPDRLAIFNLSNADMEQLVATWQKLGVPL